MANINQRSSYKYRVNFGQGQVHYPGDRKACWRFIASLDNSAGCFVEWQDPDTGDWFSTGNKADELRDVR